MKRNYTTMNMPKTKRHNLYKEALINPITGPLVGVPSAVPIDTHRTRLKCTGTISITTGGALTVLVNPVAGLCNDLLTATGTSNVNYGALNYWGATSAPAAGTGLGSFFTNAQYTASQFAGRTTASSVRARVVSAALRICNVSAANDRNGVFTLFCDPQHNTLQAKTASNVATDLKARQFNASTPDWHTVLYHPVDPEEADGWVWDPVLGYQAGVKAGSYVTGGAADGTPSDAFPGYMGIWWNGDTSKAQTFQVELYIIAEYVGSLVQPLVRENEARIEDAGEARSVVENHTVLQTPQHEGAQHTGHPASATHPRAQRLLQFAGEQASGVLHDPGVQDDARRAAAGLARIGIRRAAVAAATYFGGPTGGMAAEYATRNLARTPGRLTSGGEIPRPRSRASGSSYGTPYSRNRSSARASRY